MIDNQNKISIVTSTLNCANALRVTARSIAGQTHQDLQWIVADGASTDGTLDVLNEFSELSIEVIHGPDRGIYDAWNKACLLIRGEWTIFLGAGDYFDSPQTLELVCKCINENAVDNLLIYGGIRYVVDSSSSAANRTVDPTRWDLGLPQLPPFPSTVIHSSLLGNGTPFDPSYKIAADSKFLLQCVRQTKLIQLDTVVTCMPLDGISNDPRHWALITNEKARIVADLAIKQPVFWKRPQDVKLRMKPIIFRIFGSRTRAVLNFIRHASRLIQKPKFK